MLVTFEEPPYAIKVTALALPQTNKFLHKPLFVV